MRLLCIQVDDSGESCLCFHSVLAKVTPLIYKQNTHGILRLLPQHISTSTIIGILWHDF